ncbi:hypothetical protein KC343_g21338 [Hortaea werneckii]|uniref:Uncharacterized protein n=1 Tax=Hortaea werneckii EXF-2000 TaxID=1157616 RepID=A0A1Z5TPS1_HORWE|nr:hypothetical protein KC350_g6816 [Hortaea werneckii]OTA37994.1 hypothetical protein BTJ68_02110 [Hortaea werneckii EXF-2000]KAI6858071.1 hypothetical protein KC323_g7136 [Hortaea werneckii]KAI6862294.1 hypothetical protein KC338_g6290 [Hortaea werneckii]KAI6935095.1 hypothetical protein KC341_g7152 [Hortaea werneckii]
MASHYYNAPHYLPNAPTHSHGHHGRSRRGPRISSQNAHRQYKAQRSPKETPQDLAHLEYLQKLEAAKSFEFDDDEVFCPFHLLTEDDLQSIHSASSSDRGSLSSGSPEGSPLQQQIQPTPSFLLSTAPNTFGPGPAGFQQPSHHQMKLHQPMAQRTRNAIPIVDPSTRSIASPPLSVSPARQMQHQYVSRRW